MIYPDLYIICIYIYAYILYCLYSSQETFHRRNLSLKTAFFLLKKTISTHSKHRSHQERRVLPATRRGVSAFFYVGFNVASCGDLCLSKRPKLIKDIATMDELLGWVCFCEEMHLYICYIKVYPYLELKWPLFLKVNTTKTWPFPMKNMGHLGSRDI